MLSLKELCQKVGCEKYPTRWENIYENSMKDFELNGCLVCKEEFYDEMKSKYDCFGEFFSLYKESAKKAAEDEGLSRFIKILCDSLLDDEHRNDDLKEFSRPICPEGKDRQTYDMCTGLALCCLLDKGAENIKKRGFDDKTVSETLYFAVGAVKSFMRTHEGRKGFDLLSWCMLYINGELFLIDRLEIQFNATFGARAMIFTNAEGQTIALAHELKLHKDGFALGAKNYSDDEEGRTLYPDGYYFTKEARYSYDYINDILEKMNEMEVGEIALVTSDYGYHVVMKYELDKGAYAEESNAEWFEGFNASVAEMLFTNKCMEYIGEIEVDEELIKTVDMSSVKPNYYY